MAPVKKKIVSKHKKKSSSAKSGAKRGGTGKRGGSTRVSGSAFFLWLKLGITLLVVMAAYLLYQDIRIRYQFEGKRWALPARVYARPLELFAGKAMAPSEFSHELTVLKYRSVTTGSPLESGSFRRVDGGFMVGTRPFRFWDGEESAQQVRVRFSGDSIASINSVSSGAEVSLLRFDPAHIASIYPSHNEDRILVRMQEVPEILIQGLLAIEDRKFYQHHGIDPFAIARAMLVNLRAGHTVQGGSTLTQQLIKNYFLTNQRSLWRKLNEASMSVLLEAHYSKEEILEAYLNEVYLGQDGQRSIHGFGLASQFYFQKPLQQLQLHEIAMLIGMVKGPSSYDPRRSTARALERRNLVIEVMQQQGIVSVQQAKQASARPSGVVSKSAITPYPAFIDLVRRQLRRDYREEDLASEGLQIFTTLDPLVQRHVEQGLVKELTSLETSHALEKERLQGAAVVTSVEQGEVVAVVGGRSPRFAGFNRALDAIRPIGSLVKPAVYLAALSDSEHYTLSSMLRDEPFEVKGGDGEVWSPGNYDKTFHGEIPLVDSLAHSYNVATARLGMEIGLEKVVDTLTALGVTRPFKPYPSMLLGAIALSPLEVAQMYQTLAGGGFHTPLRSIRAILDAHGEPLQRYPLTVTPAFAQDAVYLLNYGLQMVMSTGTGRSLYSRLPQALAVAGKTGTTDDLRDSWFAGFSGDYQAVVWLGMDDNKPAGLTGSSGALQVWGEIMQRIKPLPLELVSSANVELVWVDMVSGQKSAQHCEGAVQLPYIKGTAPTVQASCRNGVINWLKNLIE